MADNNEIQILKRIEKRDGARRGTVLIFRFCILMSTTSLTTTILYLNYLLIFILEEFFFKPPAVLKTCLLYVCVCVCGFRDRTDAVVHAIVIYAYASENTNFVMMMN